MVIHSIKLYLRDREAETRRSESAPAFKLEAEFVGVNLDHVLVEADRVIERWIASGYGADDYLAMVSSGASYRHEQPFDPTY